MKNKTHEQLLKGTETFYQLITEVEGPNESTLSFISVNGQCHIIQEFKEDGFQVYAGCKGNKIEDAKRAIGMNQSDPNTMKDQIIKDIVHILKNSYISEHCQVAELHAGIVSDSALGGCQITVNQSQESIVIGIY